VQHRTHQRNAGRPADQEDRRHVRVADSGVTGHRPGRSDGPFQQRAGECLELFATQRQDQAGHAVAATTAIYTGVSDEYRNRLLKRKLTERHAGLWEDDQP
jgi:hypothetical protein